MKILINQEKYQEAAKEAKKYYKNYTESAIKWISDMLFEFQKKNEYPMGDGIVNQLDALEGIMRDTAFNRGPGGSIIFFATSIK